MGKKDGRGGEEWKIEDQKRGGRWLDGRNTGERGNNTEEMGKVGRWLGNKLTKSIRKSKHTLKTQIPVK